MSAGRGPRRSARWSAATSPPAGIMARPSTATRCSPGLIRCRRCGRKLTLRYTGAKHQHPALQLQPRLDGQWRAALHRLWRPARRRRHRGGASDRGRPRRHRRRHRPPRRRPASGGIRCARPSSRDLEAARYAADRAFRQYDAADPANRLVAGELEARWNRALARVAEVEGKIAAHDAATPVATRRSGMRSAMLASNLKTVWSAPTTDARLKKRIVRTVIQEVVADIDRRGRRDRSRRPLDRRRSQRDAPAQTPPRSAQQHLRRRDRRRAPACADRQ